MSIVKMKKLRLMAVSSQRDAILKDLMLLGCVEITEPASLPEGELPEGLRRVEVSGLAGRRKQLNTLQNAIRLLEKNVPEKAGFLSPLPDVQLSKVLDESRLKKNVEQAERICACDEQLRRIAADKSREAARVLALEPWFGLGVPVDCAGTATTASMLCTFPASVKISQAAEDAAAASELSELYEISTDKQLHYCLLLCWREDTAAVLEALRAHGVSLVTLGEETGMAKDAAEQARRRILALDSEADGQKEKICREADSRGELKLCADVLATRIGRDEAEAKLLCTDSVSCFYGWIPAASEAGVGEAMAKYDCAWETEEPDPEKPEEVPVKIRSNAATGPFNMVTNMYSAPSYGGIDPNPFLFPTFALFFGIMFADVGYGIILVLFGLLMKYKKRARGGLGSMGGLALVCGVSCMIFGAVTGTFFGDIIYQVSSFYGGSAAFKGLIDPLAEPMTVLIICIGIGVVHLLLGVTINAYMLIRDGQWKDALWDAGSIYLMFAGIALGALGVTWWVLIASCVAIVYSQGRASKSIGGMIGSGLYGLYSVVTGWFGDVLSYSRLMALMLAGTVIAQVFNSLGAMTGNIFAFIVIFIVGHALNFGLNIIGTYVHTSRLEYLEFFGKFYREGGRPFRPLEVKSQYYNICKN